MVNAKNSKVATRENKIKSLESRVIESEKVCSYQSAAYMSTNTDLNI